MKFDDTDKKILDILQTRSNITNAQLASEVGISPSGMIERVKRLENSGVIMNYVALVDHEKVDKSLLAIVSVSLVAHRLNAFEVFIKKVQEYHEVLECFNTAGEEDFILKVAVKDMKEFQSFIIDKLTRIEVVNKVKTSFVLSTIKYSTKVEINGEE
jgi:DNA-binding Lrp family transcriptional regulator